MKKVKRIGKRILALAMGLVMSGSCVLASACSSTSKWKETTIAQAETSKANVWTTSALAKVMHQGEFSDNLCDYGKGTSVDIQMAKNEYEDGQIIISALKDIKEYTVSVTDLSDGKGNKISKDSIEFYHLKYVLIEKKTVVSSPYEVGEYPEALVPMDAVVEYGENNVKAGYNQGIYVTVKTEHETVAGEYTGVVDVVIDGVKHEVPLNVTVWDIDIPDQRHLTYMSTYTTHMAFINEGDATQEKMDKINDWFLNYYVYNETLTAEQDDYVTFVDRLVKYKDQPKYFVALPFVYNPFYTEDGLIYWDVDSMRTLLMRIVDQSVQDGFCYSEMVQFYPYWYDEWQYKVEDSEEAVHAYLSNIRDEALFFRALCKEVVTIYDKCYGSDKIDSVEGLRESILGIKMQMSGEYNETSAPYMEPYDIMTVSNWQFNQEERAYVESIKEKGFLFGAYNCNWPRYPRLAVHTDSSLVEARIFGYQMYDFGAYAMLYHRLGNDSSFENVYENLNDIMLKFTANGDGLLAYPGVYYGLDGLVASNRLHAIRDSLEDYEYLYLLDEAYAELSEYYGIEITSDEFLNSIYYTLYADNPDYQPNRDINVFNQIKEKVFQSIDSAQREDKMVLESKYDTSNSTTVKMLFSAECELQGLNDNPFYKGREAVGKGYRYTFEYPKNEDNHSLKLTYLLNGETKTYEMEINRGSVVIDSFANNDKQLLSGTENVTIAPTQIEGVAMTELTFTSVITGDEIVDSVYMSRAFIDADALIACLDSVAGFTLDVYNPTDQDVTISLYYEAMAIDIPLETVTIKAKEFKTLTFYNLEDLKKALNIIIQAPNTGTTETPDVYKLLIANLKYIKKGE